MSKHFLLWFLTCCMAVPAISQQFTVSGYVTDEESGEAIIGANVFEPNLKVGTTTNNQGYYSLPLPFGNRVIQTHYVGYYGRIDSFYLGRNITRNIRLALNEDFDEIVVKGKVKENIEDDVQGSYINVPMSQIKAVPTILGEVDVIKALQLLPGVQSGGEGSSGLYVRGGSPDQNLILLDGVPVYNINHLFGFFSAFNSEAINNVQLYKGGFPARFGSRLSGVLDIAMKDGNNQEFGGNASISPVAINLMLEGPLVNEKTTFAISGRRSLFDIFYGGFNPLGSGLQQEDGGFYFYDMTAKVSHRFSDKDRLSVSFYNGRDKFYSNLLDQYQIGNTRVEDRYESDIYWGNLTASARWTHVFSPRLFGVFSGSFTRYQFNISDQLERREVNDTSNSTSTYLLRYFSGIRDWSAKGDFEYAANNRNTVRFGGIYTNHGFAPGATQAKFTLPANKLDTILGPSRRIISNELAVYVEDDVKVSARFRVNAGLRLSLYTVNGAAYANPEPRFSFRYFLTEKLALKGSYSYMNQYLHLLTNSGLGLPTDLWVPATERIKPQSAHQVAAGLARTFKKNIEFTVEGYYKRMNRVLDYVPGADFMGTESNWETRVSQGKGWAYGVEFLLQKKEGKYTGWIGYTLAWNMRQFADINNGKAYPFRYDRRHDISIVNSYKVSERTSFSATFVFGTGNAITFPFGRYLDINGNIVYDYVEKNSYRMRNNIRVDVGMTSIRGSSGDYESSLIFSIYNLTNRRNPYFIYLSTNDNGEPVAKEVSLLPFIPAITYSLKF